jgi:hypothetical protein
MWNSFLADVIVGFHLAYVSFVIFGQLAILVGVALKWKWIRNPWFRWFHLLAILTVAYETLYEITCPLTDWEWYLRRAVGENTHGGETFIGRLLHQWLFFYEGVDQSTLNTCYIVFALLVLATFCLVPPRKAAAPPFWSALCLVLVTFWLAPAVDSVVPSVCSSLLLALAAFWLARRHFHKATATEPTSSPRIPVDPAGQVEAPAGERTSEGKERLPRDREKGEPVKPV